MIKNRKRLGAKLFYIAVGAVITFWGGILPIYATVVVYLPRFFLDTKSTIGVILLPLTAFVCFFFGIASIIKGIKL